MRVPTYAQQNLALRIGQRALELEDPRATGAVGAALGRAATQVFDDTQLARHRHWKAGSSAAVISPEVQAQGEDRMRMIRRAVGWLA